MLCFHVRFHDLALRLSQDVDSQRGVYSRTNHGAVELHGLTSEAAHFPLQFHRGTGGTASPLATAQPRLKLSAPLRSTSAPVSPKSCRLVSCSPRTSRCESPRIQVCQSTRKHRANCISSPTCTHNTLPCMCQNLPATALRGQHKYTLSRADRTAPVKWVVPCNPPTDPDSRCWETMCTGV